MNYTKKDQNRKVAHFSSLQICFHLHLKKKTNYFKKIKKLIIHFKLELVSEQGT